MENTISYDKKIALLDGYLGHEQRAGLHRVGGQYEWHPGYQVDAHILCYCTKCGAVFHGRIERLYYEGEKYQAAMNLRACHTNNDDPTLENHCPICGNEFYIAEKDECCYWGDNVVRIKDMFFSKNNFSTEMMNKWRKEDEYLRERRLSQIEKDGASVPSVINTDAGRIKNSPEELKKYIFNLLQLEGNIYALKKRLMQLYSQQRENDQYAVFCENIANKYIFVAKQLEKQSGFYQKHINATQSKLDTLNSTFQYPPKPTKPQLFNIGAFDFIVGNARKNEALMAAYEAELADYHNQVADCDAKKAKNADKIATYEKQIKEVQSRISDNQAQITQNRALAQVAREMDSSPALVIKSMLDTEIQLAEKALHDLIASQTQLYNFNVIFKKYRDVVALSTFYEYLMAGRCRSLEGANGAYNLYESEIRANLIISKLDDVLLRLDKIIDNQYTISRMMSNINDQLNTLNDTMGKAEKSLAQISQNTAQIAQNSEVIAHNTAVSAYYSKVNAELTNSMGYLMAYKL